MQPVYYMHLGDSKAISLGAIGGQFVAFWADFNTFKGCVSEA